MRNEPAQIFAVINQSRSTETNGGSCIHLAQPKIRSGTFLAATLGRLGLLGRGNEHLAMHVGLPESRRDCYFPSCTCPLWICTRLLAVSLHGVGCNQLHGEQEVLELCLKVWSFLQQVSCLELCQGRSGQHRSSTEHTPAPEEQVVAAGRVPPCRCIAAGIWEVEVSQPWAWLCRTSAFLLHHILERRFAPGSWKSRNQVNMVLSMLG